VLFQQMNTEQQLNRRGQCGVQSHDLDAYDKKALNKLTQKHTKNDETDEIDETDDAADETGIVDFIEVVDENNINDKTISVGKSIGKDIIVADDIIKRTPANIFSIDKYPIIKNRWGFLPLSIELFLHTDNSTAVTKNNPAMIVHNQHPLLRYGVEQSQHQSFLGCIADIYAYHKNIPPVSIMEFRNILADNISIDNFIKYHNGVLATTFKSNTAIYLNDVDIENYKDTTIYKSIDLENPAQKRFMYDTVTSYQRFIQFLQDEDSFIDHVYLWDIICASDSTIFKNGLNMAIMEIMDNDITDNVELICPTNTYSEHLYDSY